MDALSLFPQYTNIYRQQAAPLFGESPVQVQPRAQQAQPLLTELNPNNPQHMKIANTLYAAKLGWDLNNQDAVNYETEANNAKDDTEREAALLLRDTAISNRDDFAKSAAMARNTGNSLGLNFDKQSGLGSGNTLEEAAQTLNNLQEIGYDNAINKYQSVYSRYVDETERLMKENPRWSRSRSEFEAKKNLPRWRDEAQNNLVNTIDMYGTSPTGALNLRGLQLLGRMWNDASPQEAALFLDRFANPLSDYTQAATLRAAALNAENQQLLNAQKEAANRAAREYEAQVKMALAQMGIDWEAIKQGRQFEHEDYRDDKRYKFETDKTNANNETRSKIATANIESRENIEKMKVEASFIRDQMKDVKSKEEAVNTIGNYFRYIKDIYNGGDGEGAKELLNQVRQDFGERKFKAIEYMNADDIDAFNEQCQLLDKVIAGEISLAEMEEKLRHEQHSSVGNLSRDNHNVKANEKAKTVSENAAKENQEGKDKREAISDNPHRGRTPITNWR